MKLLRILSLALALITCLSFFACKNNGETDTEHSDTVGTTVASAGSTETTETTEDTEENNAMEMSEYYVIADGSEFAEALEDLKSMIRTKYNVELASNGESGIRLTSDGANDNTVSATIEGNELVIRAKDNDDMKKAVVCFWYENIAYSDDAVKLSSDFNYSKDLSKVVFYSDFDVTQSDNECCLDALISAHNYANENNFKVFADYNAKYYVASAGKTANIMTDVEWGNASFTVDDSKLAVEDRDKWIFDIISSYGFYSINSISKLDKETANIGITLPQKSIVVFKDSTVKHYIRSGGNANEGKPKQDQVVVDVDGSIDPNGPFLWDFDRITSAHVLPIDLEPITVSGGVFTTIANQASSTAYYARGIRVARSNTKLANVKHYVVGEGDVSAPYYGFYNVKDCAYVTIENCVVTGHKTYAGGTYDICLTNAVSVSFINCTQSNDINDSSLWGVMASNYCKDIVYDGCTLSRFDAHHGVVNATIKNSVIGHGSIGIIGGGTLLVENTKVYSEAMINLRHDYGSSWNGDIIIRDCEYYGGGQLANNVIIRGTYKADHDHGYICYMPRNVVIDGLYVDTYLKTYAFEIRNSATTGETTYPYVPAEKVTVTNFSSLGGKSILLSNNHPLLASTEFTVQ